MNKENKIIIGIVAVVIAVGLLVAFTSANKNSSTDSSKTMESTMSQASEQPMPSMEDAVATNEVQIKDFKFGPQVIKIKVGDTVTWTNKDVVKHDVTLDDTSEEGPGSELLAQDATYTYTFKKAGTFAYHCTPHPYMKATVIVE